MAFQEFNIDESNIAEWLPWGALIREHILRNKDESMIAFIAYEPYQHTAPDLDLIQFGFSNGWSIWSEWQHLPDKDFYVLCVCWNPFHGSIVNNYIMNTLEDDETIKQDDAVNYFSSAIDKLAELLSERTRVRVLKYQEIFDFLSFSLSFDEQKIEMPDIPMYIDCLLSQDLKTEFLANNIRMNNRLLLPLSLPGTFDYLTMQYLFNAFLSIPFRFVERLLVFGQEEAQDNFRKYTNSWSNGRKTVKRVLQEHILDNLSGYYAKTFVFLLDDDVYERLLMYVEQSSDKLQIPYVLESFNLKDVWWGTLPGLFRANLTPPILGFKSVEDFLLPPLEHFSGANENANHA